jgi:hypothetical protein
MWGVHASNAGVFQLSGCLNTDTDAQLVIGISFFGNLILLCEYVVHFRQPVSGGDLYRILSRFF